MTPREVADVISEKTRLPISLVVGLVGLVVVLVMWGKGLEAKMFLHETEDDKVTVDHKARIEKLEANYIDIKTDLAEIKGALGVQSKKPAH